MTFKIPDSPASKTQKISQHVLPESKEAKPQAAYCVAKIAIRILKGAVAHAVQGLSRLAGKIHTQLQKLSSIKSNVSNGNLNVNIDKNLPKENQNSEAKLDAKNFLLFEFNMKTFNQLIDPINKNILDCLKNCLTEIEDFETLPYLQLSQDVKNCLDNKMLDNKIEIKEKLISFCSNSPLYLEAIKPRLLIGTSLQRIDNAFITLKKGSELDTFSDENLKKLQTAIGTITDELCSHIQDITQKNAATFKKIVCE
jgi:hypothetical protein